MASITRLARSARYLHSTCRRNAITHLEMPAMSPTMTEGGIASWKKKDGEAFATGDVLLEIETDKATIDVEAQDDGVMGKVLLPDGTKNIPVGKVIALLAEEGDDISNLQPPKEAAAPPKPAQAASSPPPKPPISEPKTTSASSSVPQPQSSHPPSHSRPLFPSVHRLLLEHSINPTAIKGTGIRGMLTKGDVLAHLGQASGPLGTYKEPIPENQKPIVKKEVEQLDGPALRRLIVTTMLQTSLKVRSAPPAPRAPADFDSIIADYLPQVAPTPKSTYTPSSKITSKSTSDYFAGLL